MQTEIKLDRGNAPSESVRSLHLIADRISERKPCYLNLTVTYINCSFTLRSVAVVKRVWSFAGIILTNNRKKFPQLVFERILSLKVNSIYWDIDLVSQAMKMSRNENLSKAVVEGELKVLMSRFRAGLECIES